MFCMFEYFFLQSIMQRQLGSFTLMSVNAVIYLFDHQGGVILVSLHIIIAFVNTLSYILIV